MTTYLDLGIPASLGRRLDSWGPDLARLLQGYHQTWAKMAGVKASGSLWPSTFNIGTDCSGAEAPIWALRAMGVKFTHVFSCDWSADVRAFITSTSPPAGPIFEDMLKRNMADVPELDVYVCGFPCTPYSLLRRHKTKLMREPAAKPFWKVLELLRERKPRLAILENVMGIKKVMAKVLKDIKKLGLYSIFVIPIDSKELGEPVARPRMYFVLVRADVRVCDDTAKLADLAKRLCLAARTPVTEHMDALMLPDTSPAVRQASRRSSRTLQNTSPRWRETHRKYREQKGLRTSISPPSSSSSGGQTMTGLASEREWDTWNTVLEEHPGQDVISDVSQTLGRNSTSLTGICPTITPGGVLGVLSRGRRVLGVEKLLLHLFPLHRMKIRSTIKDVTLGKLGGNTMHLKSVALALVIGAAMID